MSNWIQNRSELMRELINPTLDANAVTYIY